MVTLEQQEVQQLYNQIHQLVQTQVTYGMTQMMLIHTFTLVVFGSIATDNPQTLSLAGNVITISGSNSNVDLTGAVDTM